MDKIICILELNNSVGQAKTDHDEDWNPLNQEWNQLNQNNNQDTNQINQTYQNDQINEYLVILMKSITCWWKVAVIWVIDKITPNVLKV